MNELETVDSVETTSPSPKRFFRFRLWMLFPLFIPAAFYALHVRSQLEFSPELEYTEDFDELWEDGMVKLDLETVKAGTNVNIVFQSQGISFSMGIPQELADLKEKPNTTPVADNVKNYIGVSGYPLPPTGGSSQPTIAPINASGKYKKRFVGQTTIRFHEPNVPGTNDGVHRIGFTISRLDTPGSMEVTLYAPDGRLIGSRTNEGSRVVFMGFQCNEEIGWLELNSVEGKDENYAFGNIVFDEIK